MNNLYQPQSQNIFSMLQNIKANPSAVLSRAGFNIPQGMNNPQDIVNHLMQTGQINGQRLARAQQMAKMYRR